VENDALSPSFSVFAQSLWLWLIPKRMLAFFALSFPTEIRWFFAKLCLFSYLYISTEGQPIKERSKTAQHFRLAKNVEECTEKNCGQKCKRYKNV